MNSNSIEKSSGPVVKIEGLGSVQGTTENGVQRFRGLPYAQSPVGALRFAAPVPVQAWEGVRPAGGISPIAPQSPSRLGAAMGDFQLPQSEDCLTVDVWTPSTTDGKRRPVAVWLHGGAYITGAGSLDWYDGSGWSREGDIVVVNLNYRLGALGFLYLPGISPGNLALLDQAMALQWVQSHISAFGGDPEQVTVIGQSAGAQSIALLLARESQAPNWCHRVILQSAPFGATPWQAEAAQVNGRRFMAELGIDPDAADARQQLCVTPVEKILAAQAQVQIQLARSHTDGALPPIAFGPVADGDILPSSAALSQRLEQSSSYVDSVVGYTREEFNVFYLGRLPEAATRLDRLPPATIAELARRRPDGSRAQWFLDLATDEMFAAPSRAWSAAAKQGGRRSFVYRFDWISPNLQILAGHCVELPFVFGTYSAFARAPMLEGVGLADFQPLSDAMRDSWLGFIRKGDPAHAGVPNWTPEGIQAFDAVCRFEEAASS